MLCLYARRSRQQDPVHGRHRVERGPGAYGHWVTDRPDPHGSSAGTARRMAVAQVQQRWGKRWNEAVRISLCIPGKVLPLYWLLPSLRRILLPLLRFLYEVSSSSLPRRGIPLGISVLKIRAFVKNIGGQ